MKKYMILWITLLAWSGLQAQSEPVKVVFDVTSADENTQSSALRHLKMMGEAYPDSEFELVVYGKALSMVLSKDSSFAEDIRKLEGNERVSIKVCAVAMKRHNVKNEDLLPGVEPVPDAIMELVKKQSEGWGYIKESHN